MFFYYLQMTTVYINHTLRMRCTINNTIGIRKP